MGQAVCDPAQFELERSGHALAPFQQLGASEHAQDLGIAKPQDCGNLFERESWVIHCERLIRFGPQLPG